VDPERLNGRTYRLLNRRRLGSKPCLHSPDRRHVLQRPHNLIRNISSECGHLRDTRQRFRLADDGAQTVLLRNPGIRLSGGQGFIIPEPAGRCQVGLRLADVAAYPA
jgi:hypothetical protein